MRRRGSERRWALGMLLVGSLAMVGDLVGSPVLVGLGAASHAAPAPKVFTTVGEAEPFSAIFALELTHEDGQVERIELDRAIYARLRGPYNRRNVVGALVAGGPHLHESETLGPMVEAAGRWALCEGPVLRELRGAGSDSDADSSSDASSVVRATVVQTGRDGRVWRWRLSC